MSWNNDDGLVVLFGDEQGAVTPAGSPAQAGEYKTIVYDVASADLPAHTVTADTILGGYANVAIPAGAFLASATLEVTTAFAGATGTLTIGTVTQAAVTIDSDGIDAAIAVTAIDAVGDTIACDGALIGTVLAADSFVSVNVGTATFTAGKARLTVKYRVPA